MTGLRVVAIAAMTEDRVIGNNGDFPSGWSYPEDLKQFRKATDGDAVLMGRTTWESLPEKRRPMPNRINIVATRNPNRLSLPSEVIVTDDASQFLGDLASGRRSIPVDTLWVIGGQAIYEATREQWDEVRLTVVNGNHQGNVHFPEFEDDFHEIEKERQQFSDFSVRRYVRNPS